MVNIPLKEDGSMDLFQLAGDISDTPHIRTGRLVFECFEAIEARAKKEAASETKQLRDVAQEILAFAESRLLQWADNDQDVIESRFFRTLRSALDG